MESQRVDRIHDVDSFRRGLTVALEGVLARLGRARRVEPLDRDAAFDARRRVPFVIGHASHGPRHELERGLPPLPGFDDGGGRRGRRSGVGGDGAQVGELVDVQGPGGHGYDELGGCEGEGEGFVGEGDLDGRRRVGRVGGEAVEVQGRVPGGGDEDVVLAVVQDGFDARGVGGEDRLRARAQVDSVDFARVSRIHSRFEKNEQQMKRVASKSSHPPSNIPIQPRGICLLVIFAETRIQDRRSVIEPVEQLAARVRGVVQVDVLVPGGDEEPERGGRELDGGDGVGRGVRELILCWKAVNFEDLNMELRGCFTCRHFQLGGVEVWFGFGLKVLIQVLRVGVFLIPSFRWLLERVRQNTPCQGPFMVIRRTIEWSTTSIELASK